MRLGGDSITFLNVTGTGQWDGKPVYGDPLTVDNVNCQPLSISEVQGGTPVPLSVSSPNASQFSDTKTQLRQVWCPPTSDVLSVTATSLAIYEGRNYQVSGDPQTWRNQAGRLEHVLIRLEMVK